MIQLLLPLLVAPTALAAEGLDSKACVATVDQAGAGAPLDPKALRSLDAACLDRVRMASKARHGMKMKDAPDKEFFSSRPWYSPNPGYNDGLLQPVDHENIEKATRAGQDAAVTAALTSGGIYAVGPACATPNAGPYTVVCLDGSRAQVQLTGVTEVSSASGPTNEYSFTTGAGNVAPETKGCVLVAGRQGVRDAAVAAPPAYVDALKAKCGGGCDALAGDFDGDGVFEGMTYSGSGSTVKTVLYRGDQPAEVATLCQYKG
ncbi:MAG: YARHG domain-containing protein [Alphaproteobacteria bacterium]|nr:YARHG domain-containing protein [Alphaproteobacteria bacterium]